MKTLLIILTVVDIVALVAVLAFYLAWVGSLLSKIATNLEDCNESVQKINKHAELIQPGLDHIIDTGGIVSGALPLLYGFAEKILKKLAPTPPPPPHGHSTAPASGRRRSRLLEHVGFSPSRH